MWNVDREHGRVRDREQDRERDRARDMEMDLDMPMPNDVCVCETMWVIPVPQFSSTAPDTLFHRELSSPYQL